MGDSIDQKIVVSADTAAAVKGIRDVTAASDALEKQLGGTSRTADGMGTGVGKAQRSLDDMGSSTEGVSRRTRVMDTAMGVFTGATLVKATEKIMDFGRESIHAASDLGEQMSKTQVVFKSGAKTVLDWSNTTATGIGVSRRAALEAAGVFGNMLIPMGMARGKAADMSKSMVNLAGDMASFNNANPQDVLEALRSGLAGESEPLRKFGVFLSADRVAAEALSLGLVKTTKSTVDITAAQNKLEAATQKVSEAKKKYGANSLEARTALDAEHKAEEALHKALQGKMQPLSAAAKAQATYALIMKDTKDAQGDYARTSGSMANEQRTLAAQWENMSAQLGGALLPAMTTILGVALSLTGALHMQGDTIAVVLGVGGGLVATYFAITAGQKAWTMATTVWAAVTKVAEGVQWLWNAAISANPIGALVVAIAAATAAVIFLYTNNKTFRDFILGAWAAIKSAAGATWGAVTKAFQACLPAISAVGDAFVAVGGFFKTVGVTVVDAAKATGKGIMDALLAPLRFGEWIHAQILTPIVQAVPVAAARAVDLAVGVWNGWVSFRTDVYGWVRNRFITPITDAFTSAGTTGAGLATHIWAGFTGFATAMGQWVTNRIVTPMVDAFTTMATQGKSLATHIWAGFTSFATAMGDWIDNRIVTPIENWLGRITSKGSDIAESIAAGMRKGAAAVADTVVNAFKRFLNNILSVINRVPFVNIPLLAQGTVTKGPQLAVIGEDGTEVVVPTSPKYRARGLELLGTAAKLMGVPGQAPGPIPQYASGAVVLSDAATAGASAVKSGLSGAANWAWDKITGVFRAGVGSITGLLPDWPGNPALKGLNALGDGVRSAAVNFVKSAFSTGSDNALGPLMANAWALAQMGHPYVWGAGHGGWNFGLPGYDCSGFASHAAKKAGSTISAPGTTMTLFPIVAAHRASPGDPVAWGFRHMEQADPRRQHMGVRILGNWYQFGDPGHSGGSDGDWGSGVYVPPGLPGYRDGTTYVPQTGPAILHQGEAVLDAQTAAAYRAGGGGVQVIIHPAMSWLQDFVEVQMDRAAESSRRRARAAGVVY